MCVVVVRLPVALYHGIGVRENGYILNIRMEDSMRTYSLYDTFVRNDTVSRDRIALVDGKNTFTFHELHEKVTNVAAVLEEKGVARGDRVAILSLNCSGFFVLLGALARLGAIMVPLNWRLSVDELSYIVKDSAPRLVFAATKHTQMANELAQNSSIHVLNIEDMMRAGTSEQRLISAVVDSESCKVDSDTPLCIIYTAAVEGIPRGAVLSHANLIAANMQVITSMGLLEADVNLNMLPLFHITGLNLALAVMQVGGRNIIIEKFTEQQTLELTESEKVTLWGSFPPILTRTMEEFEKTTYDISSLKYVVGLDNPENIIRFEKKTTAKFWILYGQSETTGFVTFSEASKKTGSAGQPGLLTKVSLIDEAGDPVDIGDIGEIAVRGPLVFQGYWKQDEVNEKTFRNGWHHTGDLGQFDTEGYLYFKGRKPEKELIKPGGENVYPAEVEAVILRHESVKAVCVIGVPDPKFGEGIKAVCVLHRGTTLDKSDLIEFVGSRIARYKKPQYVEFVEALPQKGDMIDRAKVKELWG